MAARHPSSEERRALEESEDTAMTEDETALRLRIVREICEREGDHGPMVDVSAAPEGYFWRDSMCNRSCGAHVYEAKGPITGESLERFLAAHKGQPMRVTKFEVEILPAAEDGAS
jgi:hypothetical protein